MAPVNKSSLKRAKISIIIAIISIILIIFFSIVIWDSSNANSIRNSDIVEFSGDDQFDRTTNDVTLKTKFKHYKITWTSENEDLFSSLGIVKPLDYDKTVQINAYIRGIFAKRNVKITFNVRGTHSSGWVKLNFSDGINAYIDDKPISNNSHYKVGDEVKFIVSKEENKNALVFVNGKLVNLDEQNTFIYQLEKEMDIKVHYINKDTILVIYNAMDGIIDNKKIIFDVYNINSNALNSYTPTKEGYSFMHWSKDGKTPYDFTEKLTSNLTLYAVYEKIPETFEITFEEPIIVKRGHEILESNSLITSNDKLEVLIPYDHRLYDIRVYLNYASITLDTSNLGLASYIIDNPTSDIHLKVNFDLKDNVLVLFDARGGTFNTGVSHFEYPINPGGKILDPPVALKDHYIFKYWSTSETEDIEFNLDSKIYENMTLYAVYERITYNLNISKSTSISYTINDEINVDNKIHYQDRLTIYLNLEPNQQLVYIKVIIGGEVITLTESDFVDNKITIIVESDITIISKIEITT